MRSVINTKVAFDSRLRDSPLSPGTRHVVSWSRVRCTQGAIMAISIEELGIDRLSVPERLELIDKIGKASRMR